MKTLLPFVKLLLNADTILRVLYTLLIKSRNRLEDRAHRWGNKNSELYLMTRDVLMP